MYGLPSMKMSGKFQSGLAIHQPIFASSKFGKVVEIHSSRCAMKKDVSSLAYSNK